MIVLTANKCKAKAKVGSWKQSQQLRTGISAAKQRFKVSARHCNRLINICMIKFALYVSKLDHIRRSSNHVMIKSYCLTVMFVSSKICMHHVRSANISGMCFMVSWSRKAVKQRYADNLRGLKHTWPGHCDAYFDHLGAWDSECIRSWVRSMTYLMPWRRRSDGRSYPLPWRALPSCPVESRKGTLQNFRNWQENQYRACCAD